MPVNNLGKNALHCCGRLDSFGWIPCETTTLVVASCRTGCRQSDRTWTAGGKPNPPRPGRERSSQSLDLQAARLKTSTLRAATFISRPARAVALHPVYG